jgi:two-component system NarL family sensor kinase
VESVDILGPIEDCVGEAQREIQSLDEDGLKSTLYSFASGFSVRMGIEAFGLNIRPLQDLPLPLQRSALRIVQEAITNFHRHAFATAVRIRVPTEGEALSE